MEKRKSKHKRDEIYDGKKNEKSPTQDHLLGANTTRVARDSSGAAAPALAARLKFVFGKLFVGTYDRLEYEDKD